MKIAFSTLGTPDFTWDEIWSMAKDLGFGGIEMRGLGGTKFSASSGPFRDENLAKTRETLERMKLEISCLSSGCALRFPEQREESVSLLKRYITVASALGCKFIRVLGDRTAEITTDFDDEYVIAPMRQLAPIAEAAGVTLLIETNGVYSHTDRLASVLAAIGSDAVGALWDMHHPYRFAGESAETTIQNLGAFIKYTHVKDSVTENGEVKYRMMGEGDLPIDDFMSALRSINYEGYVSLEWLKQYTPDLSDAAVVFPHFVHFMGRYIEETVGGGRLQTSIRGDGKYIWEKEHLIDLTFPQVLDRVCEEFPEQYAFRYTTLDYTRTYPEFRDDVDTFARALISLGVKQGDHVAIWATNVPQWYITFWATVKIGAVLVTVNTAYKIHEAEYLLRQSDTHTLVMIDGYKDSDYVAIMKELAPELETAPEHQPLHLKRLPFLRNIITCESKQKGCYTWEEAMEQAGRTPIESVYRRAAMINKHDVCNMQYTSGTTG
ncbi:MAG: AMP-binding protein, partial [Clostridia bacterium]|nr:AMP-binding protein [Clostridia bacterium]